jgi:hypothetical protein
VSFPGTGDEFEAGNSLIVSRTQSVTGNDEEFEIGPLLDESRRKRVLRDVIDHDSIGTIVVDGVLEKTNCP